MSNIHGLGDSGQVQPPQEPKPSGKSQKGTPPPSNTLQAEILRAETDVAAGKMDAATSIINQVLAQLGPGTKYAQARSILNQALDYIQEGAPVSVIYNQLVQAYQHLGS